MEVRNLRKERTGVVVSNKMDKTVTVAAKFKEKHPIYGKFVSRTKTPGRILIEIEGVPFETAKEALRLAAQKLPVTTKFIVRRDYDAQN